MPPSKVFGLPRRKKNCPRLQEADVVSMWSVLHAKYHGLKTKKSKPKSRVDVFIMRGNLKEMQSAGHS